MSNSTVVISAAQVKELRERTNAGMMECKRALVETQGDIDKAAENLRKKGLANADKKAGRIAAEGMLALRKNEHHAVLLEVNCETDFVARDSNFTNFVTQVADAAFKHQVNTLEEVLALQLENEDVESARRHLIAKIGENIQIRRYQRISSQYKIAGYLHLGRIAAIVEYEGNDAACAHDIAMHVVALQPMVISPEQVPATLLEKEREIIKAQADKTGKPADIIEKMIAGRIKKFAEEVSLVGQPFVKNPEQTVREILEAHKTHIHQFTRMAVGEGIEKQTEDFAAAVMAQVKGG